MFLQCLQPFMSIMSAQQMQPVRWTEICCRKLGVPVDERESV